MSNYIVVLESDYLHDDYIKHAPKLGEAVEIRKEWMESIDHTKERIYIAEVLGSIFPLKED